MRSLVDVVYRHRWPPHLLCIPRLVLWSNDTPGVWGKAAQTLVSRPLLGLFPEGMSRPTRLPKKKRRPPPSPGHREGRKAPSRREERLPQPRILGRLTDAMRTGPCGEGNWRWVPWKSSIASSCCMPVLCSYGSGLWPSSLGIRPYRQRRTILVDVGDVRGCHCLTALTGIPAPAVKPSASPRSTRTTAVLPSGCVQDLQLAHNKPYLILVFF